MLQIGIVVPSWHYYINPFKIQPLWELYFATIIKSYFRENEIKVIVIDLRETRRMTVEIEECDLYIYWNRRSGDFLEIKDVVNKLKYKYPAGLHIAGGTQIDNCLEECAEIFDLVIEGPGEQAFIDIIDQLLRGVAVFAKYRNSLNCYHSDWKDNHFSRFPYPRREFLPVSAIVNKEHFEEYNGLLGTLIQASRGCNFQCAYCNYNVPRKIQRRTPKQVEEEIEYLKTEYKIQAVNFRDEITIPLSDHEAIPFLEAVGRTDVKWRGQTRVGSSKDAMRLAAEVGCIELAVGVESASDEVLRIVNKGCNLKRSKDFFVLGQSLGIKMKMCLVLGLPWEPKDIIEKTFALIEEVQPDYVSISGLCPMPGSPIFKNPRKYGIRSIHRDWEKYGHVLYRYSDSEDFGLPFEYNTDGFTRSEIISNIQEVQHYLQERGMSY